MSSSDSEALASIRLALAGRGMASDATILEAIAYLAREDGSVAEPGSPEPVPVPSPSWTGGRPGGVSERVDSDSGYRGGEGEDAWSIVVDHDVFAAGDPTVVTLEVWNGDLPEKALACLTPTQARGIAYLLHVNADAAERNEMRRAEQ